MKRLILLLCMLSLVGGCYCTCPGNKQIIQSTLVPEEISPASPAPSQPLSVSQQTAVLTTSPSVSEVVKPAAPVSPATSKTQETKPISSTKPAPLGTSPAPDRAVFDGEPLIDLKGRLLNPLATQTPMPDEHTSVPWKGEQLKYGIYYSFVKAGTAYIKNRGLIDADGKPAFVIQTSAFSAPVIDSVFKVRDINLSWLDAQNFYSLGYSQSLREGRYKRDEWVRFDYPQQEYRGQVQKKAAPRSFSGELMQPVLDMLTSLYYVRAKDLAPGQEVVFDIINREEKYPLVVKVLGRETVKTEAGKFKCLIVEPKFRGEGIFVSKGKSLKVWLTDDEYKMPIKMKAEVFIGSVYAELLEYKRN